MKWDQVARGRFQKEDYDYLTCKRADIGINIIYGHKKGCKNSHKKKIELISIVNEDFGNNNGNYKGDVDNGSGSIDA